jgi:diguanylate cyclase (GGDEF)-like protein
VSGGDQRRTRLWAAAGACLVVLLAYMAHLQFGLGGSRLNGFFDNYVYDGLMLAASSICLWRAAAYREERAAWLLLGLGLLSWSGGDLWWTLVFADQSSPPIPSVADVLYLGFYPCSWAALALLARSRAPGTPRGLWLDGAIVAAAVSSLAAALVFEPALDAASGSLATVVTNLAYPIGDLATLGLVVGVFSLSRWRLDRAWLLIGAGLALLALADSIYLVQIAKGTYHVGSLLDSLWPSAVLVVALAAWQRPRSALTEGAGGRRMMLLPTAAALSSLFLLTYDHFERVNTVAAVMTALTLLLVTIRMAASFTLNLRMLEQSRLEARVDSLTGLRNRRSLMADLEHDLPKATAARPQALLLFDLDGFKTYNDTFGHAAGDALLMRLGARLAEAVGERGNAYRLGGDEFCALVAPGAELQTIAAGCVAALAEQGEGFTVTTSYGAALVPSEATEPVEALKLADRRMYAQKGSGRLSPGRQSRDVLLRTLSEREPELHLHLAGVAELAAEVGRALGMAAEELDELSRAAELHDIGKVAIPDTILAKPGPLDEEESGFVRRHTIIGERILMAAPALRPVARLVRSSHERFDGKGYPDGLAGEEIPLGSRVVAVCDAFDAMTSHRSYRAARSPEEALEELKACSGTQFDPRVVEAFSSVRALRQTISG